MKEELAAGIRNALGRGASLDEAAESFVRAGYNPKEVHEALELITSGATEMSASPEETQSMETPLPTPKSVKKRDWKIIGIVVLLVLIALGLVGLLLLR